MMRSLCTVLFVGAVTFGCAPDRPARTVELTSGDTLGAFPEHDARTAIAAASHGLHSCKTPDGPMEMDAILRFEPSGKVGAVEIAPFDPDVAPCVKHRLTQIEVRPFAGDATTLRARVKL